MAPGYGAWKGWVGFNLRWTGESDRSVVSRVSRVRDVRGSRQRSSFAAARSRFFSVVFNPSNGLVRSGCCRFKEFKSVKKNGPVRTRCTGILAEWANSARALISVQSSRSACKKTASSVNFVVLRRCGFFTSNFIFVPPIQVQYCSRVLHKTVAVLLRRRMLEA